MADLNDLGDIKEGFEHISEVLDSIREQNAMKTGDLDKVLSNINSKLEDLSNEENSDLIKVFLAEIKRTLDERHNFVSSKFAEIESAFKSVEEKAGSGIKAGEMRQIFDIIATNLNVFSKEVVAQKDVLSDITLRIDDLKKDDSQKRDILRNISVLKVELEKFNNGFESIIFNLNDNFKSVATALAGLDNTENINELKKEIENIFLSSNAVLSALQVIDRKNRELEVVITHLVSKEDFTLEREQVATLIAQNIQLTDYISTLADKVGVDNLNKKMDTAVGIINALKTVLQDSSNQNQQMLIAQLEMLEAAVSSIISEEDFSKFRNELFRLVEEGAQSSNLVRAELLDTNAELRNLFNFLNSFEIKSNFQQLSGLVKNTEDNVKASVWELSGKIAQENEKFKTLVTTDINGNIQTVAQKIDLAEENIKEASKSNLSTVLENIQSVINNIFAVKNEIHIDNLESVDAIESKFQDLKSNIVTSKDAIVKGSQSNFETIVTALRTLHGKIDSAKDGLGESSQSNLETITSEIGELSQKVDLTAQNIAKEVGQNIQGNIEGVTSGFGELSQKLDLTSQNINNNIQSNLGGLASGLDDLSQKLDVTGQNINLNIQENLEGVVSTFDSLSQKVDLTRQSFSSDLKANLDSIVSNFEGLSKKIEGTKNVLNQKSQEDLDAILSGVEKLSQELVDTKDGITNNSETNFSNILMIVDKFSSEIALLKESLNKSSQVGWAEAKSNIDATINGLNSLKGDLKAISTENVVVIKSEIGTLSQSIEAIKGEFEATSQEHFENILILFDNLSKEVDSQKENLSQNAKANLESISSYIKDLSKKIEESDTSLKTELKVDIFELQNSVLALPDKIKENQIAFEEEKSAIIEQNSKSIEELGVKIQNLTKGIITKDNPFKEIVTFEFGELKGLLATVQAELSQSGLSVGEEIQHNIQHLEDLITQNTDSYDVSLYNLQTKLTDYLQFIQDKAQESGLKIENSAEQILDIKTDVHSVLESVSALTSDSRFADLSSDLNQKFEGILLNITQLEEISSLKNQDNLQRTLSTLEEQFEGVLVNLESFKNSSGSDLNDVFSQLTERINTLKDSVSLANTGLIEVLNAKMSDVVKGFAPIKDSIEQLAQVDFTQIVTDVKNQLNMSHLSLNESVKDNLKENNVEIYQKISETFAAIDNRLDKTQQELTESNSDNTSDLKALLQDVSAGVESVLNTVSLTSDSTGSKDFLTDKFAKLETSIVSESSKKIDALETIVKVALSQIEVLLETPEKIEETILSSNNKVISQIVETEANLIVSQEELKASLLQGMDDNAALVKSAVDELGAVPDKMEEYIYSSRNDVVNSFTGRLGENEKNILDGQEAIKTTLIQGFDENVSLVKDNLEELISVKTDLLEEISATKNFIQDENSNHIVCIKEEMEGLVQEIVKAQENISSYKLGLVDLFKVQDDAVKDQISSVEDTILEEISQNIDVFKDTVKETSKEIESKISLSEENYKSSAQALLTDIKTSFYEKVEDGLDDLKSFLEVLENKNAYNSVIDDLKSDVFDKFSALSDTVETSFASISVKEDLDGLSKEIEISVSDLLENLYDKILIAQDDNRVNQEVLSKADEIERRVEDLKRVVNEDVVQKIESFGLNVDKQSEDFSNLITEIKVSINELKENYIDLSLNSSMEISTLLSNVQEKIENIDTKLDGYDFTSVIESSKNKLIEEISSVKDSISNLDLGSKFSSEFEGLNQKLDILAMDSGDDLEAELKADLDEIKGMVQSQGKFIENLKSLEQLEKLSKIEGVAAAQKEIKGMLSGFESKLNEIASVEVEDKGQAVDIKGELKALKKDLVENILNIFDQISFVVEAEEIKDFIDEKAEEVKSEIKDTIKSSLGNNFEDILSSLDTLHEKIQSSDGGGESTVGVSPDIKNDLSGIKKHIQILQSGSEEELSGYSYSLQDIESDIAKVRLILDEIAKSKSNENLDRLSSLDKLNDLDKLDKLDDFTALNENIISISTRTNKLLLTSDESHTALKENLYDFRQIVYKLEEKLRGVDNTESNKRIEKKLENIDNLVLTGVKSDKTFNQAFMYLAEWVDSADEKLISIQEKASEVDSVKKAISQIQKALPDKTETKELLEEISDKFEYQQKRINRLEEKIDELLSKKTRPAFDVDIKSIVEEALANVELGGAAPKTDLKLAKKVDSIDKQLSKLSKSIEKLASYVDEG